MCRSLPVFVHSCIAFKIFVVLPFKLRNLEFEKEIWQSSSMQMIFSTSTGQTEQLLQTLLSIVGHYDLYVVLKGLT